MIQQTCIAHAECNSAIQQAASLRYK